MPVYDVLAGFEVDREKHPNARLPHPGSLPFPVPCRTMDGLGNQIISARLVDTDTGYVERYDCDPGRRIWNIDPVTSLAVVIEEVRPLPITFVPLKPGQPYLLVQESDTPAIVDTGVS